MEKLLLLYQLSADELSEILKSAINEVFDEREITISKINEEMLLTRSETCKFLKIDSSTLWHWTKKGKIIAYGIGNRRYYKKHELIDSLLPLKS